MSATLDDLRSARPNEADGETSAIALPPVRWKTRVLLPGLVIVIVLALLLITSLEAILPATPIRVVPVVVKSVENAAGAVTVMAPGWLEPDPYATYVAALADGVVQDVHVLEGEPVEAGQVVASLVDDDARLALRRAEAQLRAHRAALDAADADLTAAKLDREHLVDRGRDVSVTEAAVSAARAEITKARADVAVERAQLLEIQDEFERKSKLIDTQAISEATVARLGLRVEAQRATLDATEARVAILEADLRRAEADLGGARSHIDLLIEEQRAVALAAARRASAQAAVELAEVTRDDAALQLERMEVRSPVAGVVLERLASPGSKLMREGGEHSLHVVHVYDPDHLQVRVDVPLADAAQIAIGQLVEVMVEVLPDRTFDGRVTRIVHQADIQKNTVEVKVTVDAPTRALKPEMLARVRFLARADEPDGAARQRVFAPERLVGRDADGAASALIVTALRNDRARVERRTLTVGPRRLEGWIEIDSGLQPGDLLVADPDESLEPGDRVRVVGEASGMGGG